MIFRKSIILASALLLIGGACTRGTHEAGLPPDSSTYERTHTFAVPKDLTWEVKTQTGSAAAGAGTCDYSVDMPVFRSSDSEYNQRLNDIFEKRAIEKLLLFSEGADFDSGVSSVEEAKKIFLRDCPTYVRENYGDSLSDMPESERRFYVKDTATVTRDIVTTPGLVSFSHETSSFLGGQERQRNGATTISLTSLRHVDSVQSVFEDTESFWAAAGLQISKVVGEDTILPETMAMIEEGDIAGLREMGDMLPILLDIKDPDAPIREYELFLLLNPGDGFLPDGGAPVRVPLAATEWSPEDFTVAAQPLAAFLLSDSASEPVAVPVE